MVLDDAGFSISNGVLAKSPHCFRALVALEPLVLLMSRFCVCSARINGDTQTDRQTDTQNNYRNSRCACAPRVNYSSGVGVLDISNWSYQEPRRAESETLDVLAYSRQ